MDKEAIEEQTARFQVGVEEQENGGSAGADAVASVDSGPVVSG